MKMNSNPAYRSVVFDCLRENACNIRQEHQDLASRISIALEKSRANLLNVEKLNLELLQMKVTVSDAVLNICGTKEAEYTKVVCQNLLIKLINAAVDGGGVLGSVPINRITKSDIKETLSNDSGKAAAIEEVSLEDSIEASKSFKEANPQVLIPCFKSKDDEKVATD